MLTIMQQLVQNHALVAMSSNHLLPLLFGMKGKAFILITFMIEVYIAWAKGTYNRTPYPRRII